MFRPLTYRSLFEHWFQTGFKLVFPVYSFKIFVIDKPCQNEENRTKHISQSYYTFPIYQIWLKMNSLPLDVFDLIVHWKQDIRAIQGRDFVNNCLGVESINVQMCVWCNDYRQGKRKLNLNSNRGCCVFFRSIWKAWIRSFTLICGYIRTDKSLLALTVEKNQSERKSCGD